MVARQQNSGDRGAAGGTDTPRGETSDASVETGAIERRLRFVSTETQQLGGSRIRIVVTLACDGRKHRAETEGVGGDVVELRMAADATLDAVSDALDRPDFVELVGIKLIHAFDSDLVLVAVRTGDQPRRRLLGAVPVQGNQYRAAAAATLDAVNRIVGSRLDES